MTFILKNKRKTFVLVSFLKKKSAMPVKKLFKRRALLSVVIAKY